MLTHSLSWCLQLRVVSRSGRSSRGLFLFPSTSLSSSTSSLFVVVVVVAAVVFVVFVVFVVVVVVFVVSPSL